MRISRPRPNTAPRKLGKRSLSHPVAEVYRLVCYKQTPKFRPVWLNEHRNSPAVPIDQIYVRGSNPFSLPSFHRSHNCLLTSRTQHGIKLDIPVVKRSLPFYFGLISHDINSIKQYIIPGSILYSIILYRLEQGVHSRLTQVTLGHCKKDPRATAEKDTPEIKQKGPTPFNGLGAR